MLLIILNLIDNDYVRYFCSSDIQNKIILVSSIYLFFYHDGEAVAQTINVFLTAKEYSPVRKLMIKLNGFSTVYLVIVKAYKRNTFYTVNDH